MDRAIVTGTSRGIGAAVARELLSRGWRVLGCSRSAAPAELECEEYEHVRLDLGDLGATRTYFEETLAPRLAADPPRRLALVNNAGLVAPIVPVQQLDLEELARTFHVNAVTPSWLIGFVLRAVPTETVVRVVNLSSGAATKAYPGWTAYCSSKAALRMAGQVAAADSGASPGLARRDLAVVEYAPHVVATEMQAELRACDEALFPLRARFIALHEEGELVAPEGPAAEIADLLVEPGLSGWREQRFEPPG